MTLIAPDATLELHETVEGRLREIDLRYTRGRRAIVEVLAAAGRPLSINDIGDHRPDIPRSSAYRHLVDLQNAGVVRRIAAADDYARFELHEALTHHHHHLICTRCGNIVDITPTIAFERSVARQIDLLAAAHRFEADRHSLDAYGTCADCHR